MRVVIWTEHPSPTLLDECIRHGARRPIRKHLPLPELLKALAELMDDERRLKLQMHQMGGEGQTPGDSGLAQRRGAGRVIVMTSGYAGGAGKTTFTANAATFLANHPVAPMRTALLDLEKGRGSIRVLFDPQMPPKPSILDFSDWAGQPQIPPETLRAQIPRDTVAARKYHLTCVFGAGTYRRSDEMTPELVSTVVTSLRFEHETVLIDLPGDMTDAAVTALKLATHVLWFVRCDIKDFERHADILAELRRAEVDTSRHQAVVTMVPPNARPPFTPAQVHKTLGMRLMPWALPWDPKVAMAVPGRLPATEDRNGPYMTAVRQLLEELCPEIRGAGPGAAARPRGGLGRFLFGRGSG